MFDTSIWLATLLSDCKRTKMIIQKPKKPFASCKSTMPSISKEEGSSIQWRKGELIGSGNFGRVYMGMNTESGELIAVKEAHTKALQEEVKVLESLSHPKIVRYLGTEREDETLTMLLEYVPGGSIQSLLGKFGSFSIPVIKRFTKQLLLGLEYLHTKGIIHGDIKGANVLVDNKGRIKLADFGTSKQAAISGAKPTRGTPYWMAPEVIRGTGHNFSADIWSVGCTVIEMATGNPPWDQQFETIAAFFYCVGTTKSHPPIPEHLSSSAKGFLHECLQKEPNMRPSASELLKHPFLASKEVESQTVSHTAVTVGDMHSCPIMEVEVTASSLWQSYSEETDSKWSDHDANSSFGADSASGRTGQLIAEVAIKNIFSKFLKTFMRQKKTTKGSTKGKFKYASIMVATCNFSEENKIGQGGYGTVYKGKLVNGQEVAVKRNSRSSRQGKFEFNNELRIVRELQHRNLIKMLGFCHHSDEYILIYEYMPHKSLDHLLFGSTKVFLNWNTRFNIIEGIAQGLVYLHKYSRMRVIHRDIKASNILLDEHLNPKISDFGLARVFARNEEEATTSRIFGTYGYMAPEYAFHGSYSQKSDVYSFGVLMLQIINGNRVWTSSQMSLVTYAWELWKKGAELELMDQQLCKDCVNKDQLLRCIHVGLLCVQENPTDRPTISDVISMLTNQSIECPKPTVPFPEMNVRYRHTVDTKTMSVNGSINSMSLSDFEGR